MPALVFPSVGVQILSSLIHFLGVSILSHCLSRRLAVEHLTSFRGLSQLSWPRLCIILVFLDSWLFLFASGVLIFGAGLELRLELCSSAIYLCIVFYATSKILIYFFLIERVYVVWAPRAGVGRFKSPIYIVCFVTVSLYSIIIALMMAGRTYHFREPDSVCMIGLKPFSSIPLLTYDLYINIFLTAMFVSPLLKTSRSNPRVKKLARRALVAASIGLTTSSTNIIVLAALKGELGWICLGSCGIDVILNALALFWVTSMPSESRSEETSISSSMERKRQVQFISSAPSQQLRSILRVPQPVALDTQAAGPHPITRPYYQTRVVSPTSSVSSAIPRAKASDDPSHPFARASFMPSVPEPEIRITADAPPFKVKSPSALDSLVDLFRTHPTPQQEAEIQITVTTQVEETESIHELEDRECVSPC